MKKQTDRQIIEEMQQRRKASQALCAQIHAEYKKHKRFALAENGQWTEEEVNRMGEPCMQVNRLLAYVMQVCNTLNKQDIGCDVQPVSEGADKVLARVRQAQVMAVWEKGMGKAASAYILKDQLCGGIGVIYPVIDYANDKGFEKCIKFRAIKDVSSFWWDNSAQGVAFEDMDYAGIDQYLTKGGFEKRYGEYKPFSSEEAKETWEKGEKKRVTEYWRKRKTGKHKVFLLMDDTTITEAEVKERQAMGEEIPFVIDEETGEPVSRTVYDCVVEQFVIGNDRILQRSTWPLDRLPFKVAKGREYWEDGKLTLQPMTLAAENPQKKYNFIESQKAIMYSKGPLEIVFVPAGGDSAGLHDKLQEASRNGSKNIIVVPYQTHDDAGNLLPKPEFKRPLLVDGGMTQEAQLAIKDIEACFGMINAGWVDRPKSTSGIAIERTEAQGETANFDYPMAWLFCLEELFKDVMALCAKMSIPMQVKLAGEDQREEVVWVNNQRAAAKLGMKSYEIDPDEEYSLSIKARPAPDTMRQKSFDQMSAFAQRHPNFAPMFADLDARASLDNLYSDDIADRLHKAIASQFPGVLSGSDDPRVVALQQQNQAMQQALGQLQQQAEQQIAKLELQLQALKADKGNEAEKIRIEAELEQQRIDLEAFSKVTDRMKALESKWVESPNADVAKMGI